jgi:hypothetical protein
LLYKSLRPHLEEFPYSFLAIPFSILLTGVYAYYYPSISACKDGMLITWTFLEPVFIVVLGSFIPFMFVATKDIKWDRGDWRTGVSDIRHTHIWTGDLDQAV